MSSYIIKIYKAGATRGLEVEHRTRNWFYSRQEQIIFLLRGSSVEAICSLGSSPGQIFDL